MKEAEEQKRGDKLMLSTKNLVLKQYYYNLRLSIQLKEKPCIMLTQENLIDFLVQSIYLHMLD